MNGILDIEAPVNLEELRLERFVSDAAVIDDEDDEQDEREVHRIWGAGPPKKEDAAVAAAATTGKQKKKDARGRRRSSGAASVLSVLRKLRRDSTCSASSGSGAWIDLMHSDDLMSSIEFSHGDTSTSYDDSIVTSLLQEWDYEADFAALQPPNKNDQPPQPRARRTSRSFCDTLTRTTVSPKLTLLDRSEGTTECRWHNGSSGRLEGLSTRKETTASPVPPVSKLVNEQWPLKTSSSRRKQREQNRIGSRMGAAAAGDGISSNDVVAIPQLTPFRKSEGSMDQSSRWHNGSNPSLTSLTSSHKNSTTAPPTPMAKLVNEQWPLVNTKPLKRSSEETKNTVRGGGGGRISRTDRIKANKLSEIVASSRELLQLRVDDCPFLIQRQPTKTPESSICAAKGNKDLLGKRDQKPSLIQRNSTKSSSTCCASGCVNNNKADTRPCLIHRQSTKSTTTTCEGCKRDRKPTLIQRNSTKSTCRSCNNSNSNSNSNKDSRPCLIHRNSTKSSAGHRTTSGGEARRGDLSSLAE